MRSRPEPLFKQQLWQEGISPVAGVDEVGVGAWAGPVIAAAVILPPEPSLAGLNDSKLLSAKRRAALFDAIGQCALAIGVGRCGVDITFNCANSPKCSVAQVPRAVMQHDDDDVRLDAMRTSAPALLHLQQQREPVPLAQASLLVICGPVVQPCGVSVQHSNIAIRRCGTSRGTRHARLQYGIDPPVSTAMSPEAIWFTTRPMRFF